ncbi:MAG: hypothetical protein LH473_05470, partial [Chitinophagales bacterium]|nr:hypothetical protein [Chitinophagales bacterium]
MKKKNVKPEEAEAQEEILATEPVAEINETVVPEEAAPENIADEKISEKIISEEIKEPIEEIVEITEDTTVENLGDIEAAETIETKETTETTETTGTTGTEETTGTIKTIETTEATESTETVPSDDNAAFINKQIEKLIQYKEEKNFTDFWFYVKELNTMIFTLKGVPRAERNKFKDRITELCDAAKKTQDELKVKVAKTSGIKLDSIKKILEEAFTFGTSNEELEKSFVKVEEANKFLREGIVKAEDGEESADMSRNDRERAKELIKKAKDQIFDRKRAIREDNFKKDTERLNAISDNLMSQGRSQNIFNAIKKLREEMRLMTLDRTQVRDIDNVINTIWKKAIEKI